MDLKNFDTAASANKPASLQLRNPSTDEPLMYTPQGSPTEKPVTISLYGKDSKVYTEKQKLLAGAQIKQSMNRRNRMSVDQMLAGGLDLLVAATAGWDGIIENNTPVVFSPDEARRIYTTYPWIKEQVDEFISDRGNFLGN